MKIIKLCTAFLLLPIILACSEQSGEELMSEATDALQKQDYNSASISLKNIIQRNPNYPLAREMLGLVYLNQGMYLAAEKEFGKVIEPSGNSIIGLAEVYLWQEKYQEVLGLELLGKDIKETHKSKLSLLQAVSFYRTGQRFKALNILKKLSSSVNQNSATYLASAYIATINGNYDEAKKSLELSLAEEPSFFLSYDLKSIIASLQDDIAIQTTALESYLTLRKKDYKIKVRLADSLIIMQRFEDAEIIVNQLLDISENQPYFNQLKAIIEFEKDEINSALSFAEKSLQNDGGSAVVKLIAALANYRLGNSEQSHQQLKSIINVLPKDHFAHKLFALLQLQLGYSSDAKTSLDALDSLTENDAPFFLEATKNLLIQDEKIMAKDLLRKVNLTASTDDVLLRQIGSLKMFADDDSGIIELKQYFDKAQTSEALIALGAAYIDLGQHEEAIRLTENWLKRFPDDVIVINFQARAFIYAGKINDAELAYKRTLQLQPLNLAANLYSIEKLVKQKNTETADKLFSKILNANPNDVALLLRYFQFSTSIGREKQALTRLQKAKQQNDEIEYELIYAGALSFLNRPVEVIEQLSPLTERGNANAKYWMLLGSAFDRIGQKENALKAYTKWLNLEESINAYVKTAYTAEQLGMLTKALQTIDNAVKKFPQIRQLDLIKAHLFLENSETYNAKLLLDSLPSDFDSLPSSLVLRGRIKLVEGDFTGATKLFKRAYDKDPTNKAIDFYLLSLIKMGEESKAIETAYNHLSVFPNDTASRLMLANILFTVDQSKAIKQYQTLAESFAKNNVVVLNNLAWLLNKQGNSEDALLHINNALEILPEHPFLLSTFGSIQTSLGAYDEAVKALEKAFTIEPKSIDIGIEYITALHKSGDREKALEVIEELSPKTQSEINAVRDLAVEIGV